MSIACRIISIRSGSTMARMRHAMEMMRSRSGYLGGDMTFIISMTSIMPLQVMDMMEVMKVMSLPFVPSTITALGTDTC